jgi:hypothetical protein
MKVTDTDGILDRCHCGGHACFRESSITKGIYRAECAECPEQSVWHKGKDQVMISWNTLIRKIKNIQQKGTNE